MLPPTVQIDLPGPLLDRARVETMAEARDLVTFLLGRYVHALEVPQRRQAYEAYYASRPPEDESDERALIGDFAFADADVTDSPSL